MTRTKFKQAFESLEGKVFKIEIFNQADEPQLAFLIENTEEFDLMANIASYNIFKNIPDSSNMYFKSEYFS